jgi:hypothetical protein
LHVPDRVAYIPAARRLDAELARGKVKQIGRGLGMLDMTAVDDGRPTR